MSEDLDSPHPLDDEPQPHQEERVSTPPAVQQAAFGELERRHRVVAEEYARLTAILEAAGWRPGELDATTDLRGSSYNGDGALAAWDRGSILRGGALPPEPQRVIHLGTERNYPTAAAAPRRNLAVGLSAAAVGAVVAAALVVLVMQPRAAATDVAAATGQAAPSEEAGTVESLDPNGAPVTPPTVAPAPSSQAIDAVLVRAAGVPNLAPSVNRLVERLPALASLSGLARQEEAADIYGYAVQEARTDTSGVAGELVAALEPELTEQGVLSLAINRPDVAGPGFAALVGDLQALPALPEAQQQQAAQDLIDAVAAGVANDTIGGPFCNAIMYILMPYGITAPS